jgi:hypothetical protein
MDITTSARHPTAILTGLDVKSTGGKTKTKKWELVPAGSLRISRALRDQGVIREESYLGQGS